MENENNLKIGTRYWLDYQKDCSGVYDGNDDRAIYFKNIVGHHPYAHDEDGRIPFPKSLNNPKSFIKA